MCGIFLVIEEAWLVIGFCFLPKAVAGGGAYGLAGGGGGRGGEKKKNFFFFFFSDPCCTPRYRVCANLDSFISSSMSIWKLAPRLRGGWGNYALAFILGAWTEGRGWDGREFGFGAWLLSPPPPCTLFAVCQGQWGEAYRIRVRLTPDFGGVTGR